MAALFSLQPSEITSLTASGVIKRGTGGYELGKSVSAYCKYLRKKADGRATERPTSRDKESLEIRKLEAQIEAVEMKNERIATEYQRAAFRELQSQITMHLSRLKDALRGDTRVERAWKDLIDGINEAECSGYQGAIDEPDDSEV